MANGYLKVKSNVINTALQKKLNDLIQDSEVMRQAHQILGEMCELYVPQESGDLRESMRAEPDYVAWETPYARYQYEGEVYGPNIPIIREGIVLGWFSRRPKYPTGRRLGVPHEWKGWQFGYSTPGTGDHWFDKAMANGGRRTFSLCVTNMLKQEAKKRNKL